MLVVFISSRLAGGVDSFFAVPVSLVGTFALFPLLGFSINTLSLFGLVLAIAWWWMTPLWSSKRLNTTSEKECRPRMQL